MPAKQLLPNQHVPLHFLYGEHDCCLCRAEKAADNFAERAYADATALIALNMAITKAYEAMMIEAGCGELLEDGKNTDGLFRAIEILKEEGVIK